MPIIFAFLRANWQLIGASLVVLFVLGYITILKSQLNASKARESALLVNIQAKEAEIKQWNDLVAIQNASIDNLGKETAKAKEKSEKAHKLAMELRAKAQRDISDLQQIYSGIKPSNECSDVERVFEGFR